MNHKIGGGPPTAARLPGGCVQTEHSTLVHLRRLSVVFSRAVTEVSSVALRCTPIHLSLRASLCSPVEPVVDTVNRPYRLRACMAERGSTPGGRPCPPPPSSQLFLRETAGRRPFQSDLCTVLEKPEGGAHTRTQWAHLRLQVSPEGT